MITQIGRELLATARWGGGSYNGPSPGFIKRSILKSNSVPGAVWIETGTYRGDTANFLSKNGSIVHTIEPEPTLAARAQKRFERRDNVIVHHGESEKILPELLPKLSGCVNFWLDGHFSGGQTFKGSLSTPIEAELSTIEKHLYNFEKLVVFVDDVRLFCSEGDSLGTYPNLMVLVEWAQKNTFAWSIKQDIFIAKKEVR